MQRAQERRAEESKERAGKSRVPAPLEVGQLVLLRRPPAAVRDHQDQGSAVSGKLQPKARVKVYGVIKRAGDSNYVLGDVATGKEVRSFKQPVHADRIVPMDGGVLDDLVSGTKEVVDQRNSTITQLARDRRVLIQMASTEAKDELAYKI